MASNGLRFAQYTSKESEFDRKEALKAFSNDTYSTLVAIKCLDEGIDIPKCERAIILASSTNPREFIQRRGRILRPNGKKKLAEIYDFVVVDDEYQGLVKKEFERVYEFSRIAVNKKELFETYKKYFNDIVEVQL